MGQKTNPIGFRTGITEGWKSRWYAPKAAYGEFLVEDARIRNFIDARLNRRPPYAAVSKVEIERTRNTRLAPAWSSARAEPRWIG